MKALGVEAGHTPEGLPIDSPGRSRWLRQQPSVDAGNSSTMARVLMGMLSPVEGLPPREGETVIKDVEWVDTSFPGFFRLLSEVSGGVVRIE